MVKRSIHYIYYIWLRLHYTIHICRMQISGHFDVSSIRFASYLSSSRQHVIDMGVNNFFSFILQGLK